MNRSRYVPHYAINPYQTQQPYGAVPPHSQMPGMMPQQSLAMPPPGFPPGMGQSPIQASLSPNGMWSGPFANGPIIEDLCAPPHPQMGLPSASPPMPGFPPPRMAMAPMHPGAMPQVQNVYGMPQHHHPHHAPLGFAPPPQHGMHPHLGPGGMMQMQGMPAARVVGTYPPYTGQQHGIGYGPPPPPPGMMDPSGMLTRPRLETGFPAPVVSGMPMGGSPSMGGSPGGDGMLRQPLTPVEEALRGFLSPELGDLGHP